MSIESKLSRLDKFESKLEESNTKINEIGYNALYRAYVALAKSINQNVVENYQAFFYAIQSLYFALEADRKRKEISFLIYDIERYALILILETDFSLEQEKLSNIMLIHIWSRPMFLLK